LALDGQLKLGISNQLLAAPPTTAASDPMWKTTNTDEPVDKSASAPGSPDAKDANAKAMDWSDIKNAMEADKHRLDKTNAGKVLKAYVTSAEVVAAAHEEAQDGPKISIPETPEAKQPKADPKVPGPEPVEIIQPTPVKPAPKPIPPLNIPVPVPPKKIDAPGIVGGDESAPKLDKVPAPKDTAPAPKAEQPAPKAIKPAPKKPDPALLDVAPEPIPTLPTPESGRGKAENAENTGLAAEIETLKTNERLLYDGALVETKLKNYPVAIERFEQLLRLRPDLLFVREQFAGILITANELTKAVEQFKRLIERSPQTVQFRIRLGDALIMNKQYREAIMHFMEALRLRPNEPEYAVRLARAYAFDNDYVRATEIYERYLAQIKPDDPKAPLALGALLLDLDRPTEAIPFLLAKRRQLEKNQKDSNLIDVLASLVRGYARVGERGLAMEILNEMATRDPENVGVRVVLGNTLVLIEEFELAGQVYNQALQAEPTNGPALIGLARVHLEMFAPANCRRILDSFVPTVANQRSYLMTYAAYHERIGEYIEAKQIYKDMLRRNMNDHEVRYALGALLEYIKEWEKAKAEFAKIPPTGSLGKRSRMYFAQTLFSQRKFAEAVEVVMILVHEDPTDANALAAATKYLAKAGKCAQAFDLARNYLATNPKSEWQALAVRLALARALLDSARYLESAREYEIALSRPSGRVVTAFYGLARASEKLGNPQRAAQLIACVPGLPGGDVRNRLLLADQYSVDFEDMPVIDLCQGILHGDPQNLSVLIRLADAQQRQSRWPGNPADAFTTCLSILKLSPTNVRGHLAMSRSFAVAQNFRKSAAAYDNLIRIDPEFTIPARERARVLYSDKQYSAARSQYDAMLAPTPDDIAFAELNATVQADSKLKAMFAPYLAGKVAGPMFRGEMARLATSPDEDVRSASQRLLSDYDATVAWQQAFVLERDAKELKNFREFEAMPAYDAANKFEPTNTETLFDMGQVFASRNWTHRALDLYSDVLAVDPTNRDAAVASERANAEIGPKLDGIPSYFYQRGRNGLANIDRQKYTVAGRVPLGDENEFLQIGYSRVTYQPTDDAGTEGNIPFIRAQKRFDNDRILAYGQLNLEEFGNYFHTRPTFDTGAYYYATSWLTFQGGAYLENVAENGESMRQDIYRYGLYFGDFVQMTRTWGFGGQYRWAHYSDNNDMHQFNLHNENSLTLPPKQLKIVENVYFMGYREQSIFPTNPPDPNDIFGTIHPYFAPRSFLQTEVRVEWYHWLSRDYFAHSNQCWYTLQYGLATDNSMVTYQNLRAMFNYDVCTWLTVGTDCNAQLSNVYKMFSAMGYLQIRFR